MPDSPYLARMKQRKADLESKLQRLNAMDPKLQPGLDLAKKSTQEGIAQLETEIKHQTKA